MRNSLPWTGTVSSSAAGVVVAALLGAVFAVCALHAASEKVDAASKNVELHHTTYSLSQSDRSVGHQL